MHTLLGRCIRFFLENKVIATLLTALCLGWGLLVAPFNWELPGIQRDPVPVDAIPDTGDNQQIVFTEWPGRSPQDVEDQITCPLTVALLGVPGVRSVRSSSMFGFSSVFVIFEEHVEFYWSRSRILEKLASLSPEALPAGVRPVLGPDATSLGQVFWYTLEGRDEQGRPAGGWDLQELRTIQDWSVRYALAGVEGVSEVASIGGHVQEYQVDVDPDALRAHGITLDAVLKAVQHSNVDVGARTLEVNRAEYVVRGLGLLESLEDIEDTVVGVRRNVPITVRQIATVSKGPALRRGVLDKGGAETVGGVVVARYGANPLAVIERIKEKLADLSVGLPSKVLDDGRTSRVTVVPFYDRSSLIRETLTTLQSALSHEILVTSIVVLVLLGHLGSAVLVSGILPLAVLVCFVAMRYFQVEANIVALSGIAIAIGTMVDVGIVLTESIVERMRAGKPGASRLEAVYLGATDVAGAILTAILTTVVSFLPVFALTGAEGKLFKPLAYTKTFALVSSLIVAFVALPAAAHFLFRSGRDERKPLGASSGLLAASGSGFRSRLARYAGLAVALWLAVILAQSWQPFGVERGIANFVFTVCFFGAVLLAFAGLLACYEPVLRWCLRHKLLFLTAPTGLLLVGLAAWLGFERLAGPLVSP